MIETRLLHYFLAVAQEGSFSGAAKVLHISQPTLSKQISELEQKLHTTLFIRSHGVELTESGLYLKARAQEILSLVEHTQEFFNHQDDIAGTVVIGTGEYRSLFPVIQLLHSLQEKYPLLRYQIVSGNADNLMEKLMQGLIDFAFLLDPVMDANCEYEQLSCIETWGVLVPAGHPLARQSSVKPSQLLHENLIISSQSTNRLQGLKFLSQVDYHSSASYNLIFNAVLMVQAGMGVAISLQDLVAGEEEQGVRFLPFEPSVESRIVLCSKKGQLLSPASRLLIKEIISHFRLSASGSEK